MDIIALWLIDLFFSARIAVFTVYESNTYFVTQSRRFSVTLFIVYFLVSSPDMGGISFPSIYFCLQVDALNVYRASNVWVDVR
jgi:hypothetical protein